MRKKSYGWLSLALVTLLIGGVVGWGLRGTVSSSSVLPTVGIGGGPGVSTSPTTTSIDQIALTNLLIQHGVMTTLHLQEIYDGKDTTTSSQLLQDNGQQIANFIGSKYGNQAQSNFLSMWQKHISDYEAYTKALKNNDANAMITAKSDLASLSSDMGKSFHQLDSRISASQVTSMMNDHVTLTLGIVNAYAQKDQAMVDKQIKAASDQAAQFAGYLTQAMASVTPPPY